MQDNAVPLMNQTSLTDDVNFFPEIQIYCGLALSRTDGFSPCMILDLSDTSYTKLSFQNVPELSALLK
jgi:hypothetical protein